MKICWLGAGNHITKDNIWNQHLHLQLLMKKRNTKLKKYRSIGNVEKECNTWCIGKIMEMNMINGLQNQGCYDQCFLDRLGQRVMMTWLAVPQVSQSVPHVVGTISLLIPHGLWLVCFMYYECFPHGTLIYIA